MASDRNQSQTHTLQAGESTFSHFLSRVIRKVDVVFIPNGQEHKIKTWGSAGSFGKLPIDRFR